MINNKEDFELKHGKIEIDKEANKSIHECRYNYKNIDYKTSQSIINGNIWNIGFYKKELDPSKLDIDYTILDKDISIAKEVAELLKDCFESSDIDCKYYPFLIDLECSFKTPLKKVLEYFIESLGVKEDPDGGIGGNSDVFYIENVTKNEYFFTALLEDEIEEINEYLTEDEMTYYRNACNYMCQNFEKVYKISIKPSKNGRFCIVFPVFVFGITKNKRASGIFTIRVET